MRFDPHFGMLPLGAFEHCGDRRIRLHGGGGGIPIVSDVVDIVQDVGSSVGDIVDGAASAVGDVVGNVATTIDNTVTAALDDPVNTAIRVVAYAYGGPAGLAAANAAIGVGQGQSLEQVATNAAISYAAAQAGAEVSSSLAPELGTTAANVAGQTAAATVRGGDPLTALVSGGVGAGVSEITKDIPGFDEMSANQQRAVNTAIAAELQGKDPSQALVNQAINAGLNAARVDINTPEEPTLVEPGSSIGYSDTTEEVQPWQNATEESGTNLSSMDGYEYDQANNIWTTPDGEEIDLGDLSNSQTAISGDELDGAMPTETAAPSTPVVTPTVPPVLTMPPTTARLPTQQNAGLNIGALLATLSSMGSQQQAPATPPPTVDIGQQLDLGSPLETNPFAKPKTQTKMAQGGSIDDLLALLRRG